MIWSRGIRILTICTLLLATSVSITIPVFAAESISGSMVISVTDYSLQDLLNLAQNKSSQVTTQLSEIADLQLGLKSLWTNYYPKVEISGKPLTITPDLTTESKDWKYNANGTLSASWKLPLGLDMSTGVNFLNLLNSADREHNYFLTVKAPIFPGMLADPIKEQISTKKESLAKANWSLTEKQAEVALQVTKKYYSTLILKVRLVLAQENWHEAEDNLKLYQNLKAHGDATQNDLLSKELTVKSNQITVERLQQQYMNSLKDLLSYAGVDSSDLTASTLAAINLQGTLEDLRGMEIITPEQLPVVDTLVSIATTNNLDVRNAQQNVLNTKDDLSKTYLAYFPSIDTQFDYKQVPNKEDYNWTFTVTASYDISDGGKRHVQVEQQKKAVKDAEDALKNKNLSLRDQLQSRLTSLHLAYLDLQSAELDLQIVQLDNQTKKDQVAKGYITKAQMTDSNQQLQSKEMDYLQKKLDYLSNYWDLYEFVYLQFQPNGVIK